MQRPCRLQDDKILIFPDVPVDRVRHADAVLHGRRETGARPLLRLLL